jgi:rubrerythrin
MSKAEASEPLVREERSLSRSSLLRRAGLGIGAISVGGVAAAGLASARGSDALSARDREVLKLALTLERLQAAFYTEAVRGGKLTGEVRQFAETVGGQERAHLAYLEKALGSKPSGSSRFRFGSAFSNNAKFVTAAVGLEETGLAAYNGQAGNLSPATLKSLARVISVEARHVAWARGLAGKEPAPTAVDAPITADAAMKAIRPYMG